MSEPSTPEIKVRKRKRRAVLSCDHCRRRKLKCDREIPCDRCVKGSIAHLCAYGNEGDLALTEESSVLDTSGPAPKTQVPAAAACSPSQIQQAPSEITNNDRVEQLEHRVAILEAQLLSLSHARKDRLDVRPTGPCQSSSQETIQSGFFKGRNYRTFFYGPTSPMTIIAHFPDTGHFMKGVYPNSTLQRLKKDMELLEERAGNGKQGTRVVPVGTLKSLLPDRGMVDSLVQRYFDTFETTYRILHIPTFWSTYSAFWETPTDPDFDAILLAVLACVICTCSHDNIKYDPQGSSLRRKAVLWIKACEAWLKRQSNKHRTLATLQVRCLRLLALSTACLKTKEIYQETEAHLAFMKSCGMHRDPDILGTRCSVFEGEMRRRLWGTSLELELQAAIDKGILDYDCTPPRNINDCDIEPVTRTLPASEPTSTFTDTSFLHCSMQTVFLRIRLCSLANSLRATQDVQQTLRHERDVQEALRNIPKWQDTKAFQAWTLLELQLRQHLVILHNPRTLRAEYGTQPDTRYAALSCLEACETLIERHIDLIDAGNYALCCIRSDYYRAALLICHIGFYASPDSIVTRVARSLFDDALQKALRLQEERAMRPGRGSHQHWYCSAAYSLVGIKYDPANADVLKRQAVDRVSRLLYKVLSLQDDSSTEPMADLVCLQTRS
ncbi:hypothetical protein BDV95DRAFT_500925 [Massariosphaeria phaeospora]|uniref:Zn(2)-C6 fungal-type domain-containing protein n=1 Tax=Massariosphaeria phaeospora TaxID=100035 RepID=A0A7C8M498_9PLEO|nr:hypothetical protein BDV95DRAFT_500925 [Massariosphaeria phaeospora]